jgi:hypothetical protein
MQRFGFTSVQDKRKPLGLGAILVKGDRVPGALWVVNGITGIDDAVSFEKSEANHIFGSDLKGRRRGLWYRLDRRLGKSMGVPKMQALVNSMGCNTKALQHRSLTKNGLRRAISVCVQGHVPAKARYRRGSSTS